MLFNSFDFAIFLPIVFFLYWYGTKGEISYQNILIVVASYIFYGWWDWRFLSLMFISTCVDYFIARAIAKQESLKSKKSLLLLSIAVNIGILGFFKYFNFFTDNFIEAFSFFGFQFEPSSLSIVLPVGISFYTFQTLSYTIDVYRGKLLPSRNFIAFSAFVSFFPQLVAGPIERATNLLPQFLAKRRMNPEEVALGLRQIVWGLFKKIVVADNCARYANEIFNNYENYNSLTLGLGAIAFAFQIYGDFSGYSDIAIGTSRLFNFQLMRNFNYPYFSRDIAEFWRRWHISLSTWFRDYVYIPLGGSKVSEAKVIRNICIIFLVSGFWHGANWTFIFWGLLNALFFLPLIMVKRNRKHLDIIAENAVFPKIKHLLGMILTFSLTTFAWIFFRANTISEAMYYIQKILQFDLSIERININRFPFEFIPITLLLIVLEWYARKEEFPLFKKRKYHVKTCIICLLIILLGSFSNIEDFIYFQF
ncbi:MAG: alginate O-acetyltransferase complex protein AlgI [Cyclobacteriaceae bacterium]|jgi:alginate O-acetyltransferase complex protein AlgI